MKSIIFPESSYTLESNGTYTYKRTESSIVGQLELLWAGVSQARVTELTKKDHRVIKSIKTKLREITMYKDGQEDSRISKTGSQCLLLESDEYDMIQKLLAANNFQPLVSDDIDLLWTSLESATDYIPEKPKLMP